MPQGVIAGPTDEFVERVAREAIANPRTVVRRMAGLPVRGAVAQRIDAVLAKLREESTSTEAAE